MCACVFVYVLVERCLSFQAVLTPPLPSLPSSTKGGGNDTCVSLSDRCVPSVLVYVSVCLCACLSACLGVWVLSVSDVV
jgi:hypothetical protein